MAKKKTKKKKSTNKTPQNRPVQSGPVKNPEVTAAIAALKEGNSVEKQAAFGDALRLIVRIAVMPFVSMAGAENKEMLLLIERISPLLVLLPGMAFGFGYTQGPARRKLIHTEIANNTKKRNVELWSYILREQGTAAWRRK